MGTIGSINIALSANAAEFASGMEKGGESLRGYDVVNIDGK